MSGFRETVWTCPEEGGRIASLGLQSFESFLRFQGGQVVSEVRDRIVFRIEPPAAEPAWFLKIYRRPGANRPFRQWMRRTLPVSLAEMEARNLDWLAHNGFIAPRVIAWGGRLSPLFSEKCSFILTEELAGRVSLEEWLRTGRENLSRGDFGRQKRVLLGACGRLLRDLHDRGFHHPFPYLRHFFVPDEIPEAPVLLQIGVIDVDFAEIGAAVSPVRRARGLAETLLSSHGSDLLQTDRLRFFQAYCGEGRIDRELAGKTWARFTQKLRRHPNRYAWVIDRLSRIPFPPGLKSAFRK